MERCRSGRSGRSRKPLYLRVSRVRIPVSPQRAKKPKTSASAEVFLYAIGGCEFTHKAPYCVQNQAPQSGAGFFGVCKGPCGERIGITNGALAKCSNPEGPLQTPFAGEKALHPPQTPPCERRGLCRNSLTLVTIDKSPCGEQEGMGVKLSGLPLSSQSRSPCKLPLRERRPYILPIQQSAVSNQQSAISYF